MPVVNNIFSLKDFEWILKLQRDLQSNGLYLICKNCSNNWSRFIKFRLNSEKKNQTLWLFSPWNQDIILSLIFNVSSFEQHSLLTIYIEKKSQMMNTLRKCICLCICLRSVLIFPRFLRSMMT